MKKIRSFSTRGFVSILLVFCFTGLAVSGLVLYFAPPCSIAATIQWNVAGLSKVQWSSIHLTSALTMLFLALIHLFVYNLKTLLNYIRQRRSAPKRMPYELFFAIITALLIYIGAITLVPPFGWLEQGNDWVKDQYRELVQPGRGAGSGLLNTR